MTHPITRTETCLDEDVWQLTPAAPRTATWARPAQILDARAAFGDTSAEVRRRTARLDLLLPTVRDAGPEPAIRGTSAGDPPAQRVLVVDDASAVRQVAVALFAAEGHHVTEAASGPEALDLIRTECFDLLVTDRAMPGMSGEQLAATVAHFAPQTRVALLTGYGDLMATADEIPPGVDLVLGKPLTLQKLRQAMVTLSAHVAQEMGR